jgi:hypothetical protein
MKTKGLNLKEKLGIQNIAIENSKAQKVLNKIQVYRLKVLENYITEVYDRPNIV